MGRRRWLRRLEDASHSEDGRQMTDGKKNNESRQLEKPIELPDCIAYPTGETCPVDWCRKARGQWCKDKHGKWCRWRKF